MAVMRAVGGRERSNSNKVKDPSEESDDPKEDPKDKDSSKSLPEIERQVLARLLKVRVADLTTVVNMMGLDTREVLACCRAVNAMVTITSSRIARVTSMTTRLITAHCHDRLNRGFL